MSTSRWLIAASVVGLSVTGVLGFTGSRPTPAGARESVSTPAHTARVPSRSAAGTKPTAEPRAAEPLPERLPPSLEGTEVDGRLEADDEGHLILGPRVIALFDYFYMATGEEAESVIRARIAAHARKTLSEPALGEALALLDRYSAYREAARRLSPAASATPEDRLRAIHDLRKAHFGDDAEALFGAEERSAKAAIDRAKAMKDDSLSPDERADRLAEIDDALPAAEREARESAKSVAQLREDEAALRANGADEAEIDRFRRGTLGDEAAARLRKLDEDRAAWKERLDTFRRDREARCHGDASCETALLRSSFDDREQIRVRAILSMP